MVVDGSICSVYLVAVLWKDTNYCSGYPDFEMWQLADQHSIVHIA